MSDGWVSGTGRVFAAYGKRYEVLVDGGKRIDCSLRGKMRLETDAPVNPVAVGDHVRLDLPNEGDGVIVEVLPRQSWVSRTATGPIPREQILAANVDLLIAVFSVRRPRFDRRMVDRLTLAAEAGRVIPVIVVNKVDLARQADLEALDELEARFSFPGYPVLRVSAETGEGIDALAEKMRNRISLFAGPSGTGKSSIANAIDPSLELRTGDVSRKIGRGRHTTTHSALLELPGGGQVVDTPGIGVLDVWGLPSEDLRDCMPDLAKIDELCQFRDCTHGAREDGCALSSAVEAGRIPQDRLDFYREMYRWLVDREAPDWESA